MNSKVGRALIGLGIGWVLVIFGIAIDVAPVALFVIWAVVAGIVYALLGSRTSAGKTL
jgi:hypothetical protein